MHVFSFIEKAMGNRIPCLSSGFSVVLTNLYQGTQSGAPLGILGVCLERQGKACVGTSGTTVLKSLGPE